MNALLVHGGERTAQGTKGGRSLHGAKAARNFLAQFHHAQIGFGPIVGGRDLKMGHEAQDQVLMLLQTQQQIERLTFLDGPTLARTLCGRRGAGEEDAM